MKNKSQIILLFVIIIGGLFVYKQYRFFRTPIAFPTDQEIQILDEIVVGNPKKDGVPAIDEPVYESVYAADQYLNDDGLGLVIEMNGRYRFYPYQILVWHEIVNDTFQGQPLLITFCPLCLTGIAFDPVVNKEVLKFGVSGKLYNSNLLMYDRKTDSLWSQALGEAVVGDMTGTELARYPSLIIAWEDFKTEFSNAEVLSRKTGFDRDYTRSPYPGYQLDPTILFPVNNKDARLFSKELVYGWKNEAAAKAWTEADVREIKVINDSVNTQNVLIVYDEDVNGVRGFSRQVEGETLTFKSGKNFLIDEETESLWNYQGEAVSGKYRGKKLDVLALENHFWFSWAASHPETDLLTK